MSTDDDRFDRPRIYAAGALVAVACVLLLVDALSREYSVDVFTLGVLLVTAGALLGVEINDLVQRR
jgi:hypothetical protein